MLKRKLPDLSKKVFPYDLVLAYWEDITSDSSWVDINDIKKSTTAICCTCLLYTSPSPRDVEESRMPSSA